MLKTALTFYAAALFFIYTATQSTGWTEISTGWPTTVEGATAACIVGFGMLAKLAGHVALFATKR